MPETHRHRHTRTRPKTPHGPSMAKNMTSSFSDEFEIDGRWVALSTLGTTPAGRMTTCWCGATKRPGVVRPGQINYQGKEVYYTPGMDVPEHGLQVPRRDAARGWNKLLQTQEVERDIRFELRQTAKWQGTTFEAAQRNQTNQNHFQLIFPIPTSKLSISCNRHLYRDADEKDP